MADPAPPNQLNEQQAPAPAPAPYAFYYVPFPGHLPHAGAPGAAPDPAAPPPPPPAGYPVPYPGAPAGYPWPPPPPGYGYPMAWPQPAPAPAGPHPLPVPAPAAAAPPLPAPAPEISFFPQALFGSAVRGVERLAHAPDPMRAPLVHRQGGFDRKYTELGDDDLDALHAQRQERLSTSDNAATPGLRPYQRARDVPANLFEGLGAGQHSRMREMLTRSLPGHATEEQRQVVLDTLEESLKPLDMTKPGVLRKRKNIIVSWQIINEILEGREMTQNELWSRDVILGRATFYLRYRVRFTQGKAGRTYVKSSTLHGWFLQLLVCIIHYARDDADQRCGMDILVKEELFSRLEDTVEHLVQKYKLDRWQDHKVYVGRAEWLMVIEQALLDSELYGRMVKLQILCAGDMTFFWTLRPGSLGPSYDEFAELGYYLLIGDVICRQISFCTYKIDVDSKHYKGAGGVFGNRHVLRADSVKHAHNVPLDPTARLITYLFLRGAFVYADMAELLATKDAVLRMKEDVKKEPLFLKAQPGGRELCPPSSGPATAAALAHSLRAAGNRAGVRLTFLGLRREAADFLVARGGERLARFLQNHRGNQGTMEKNYDRGAQNANTTSLRLDEIIPKDLQDEFEAGVGLKRLDSDATKVLVFRAAQRAAAGAKAPSGPFRELKRAKAIGRNEVTPEEKAEIATRPPVVAMAQKFQDAWLTFVGCWASKGNEPAPSSNNCWRITKDNVLRAGVSESKAKKAEDAVRVISKQLKGLKEKLSRDVLRARAAPTNLDEELAVPGVDTAERRMAALHEQEKPSALVNLFVSGSKTGSVAVASSSKSTLASSSTLSASPSASRATSPPITRAASPAETPSVLTFIAGDTPPADASALEKRIANNVRSVDVLQVLDDEEEDEEENAVDDVARKLGTQLQLHSKRGIKPDATWTQVSDAPKVTARATETATGAEAIAIAEAAAVVGKGGSAEEFIDGVQLDELLAKEVPKMPEDGVLQFTPLIMDESQEENALALPPAVLRAHAMEFYAAPVLRQRVHQTEIKANGGKLICKTCLKFPDDHPRHGAVFSNLGHYNRHQKTHTTFHDLMFVWCDGTKDHRDWHTFTCNKCAHKLRGRIWKDLVSKMRTHATTVCEHRDHFLRLQAEHDAVEKRPARAAAGADGKKKKRKAAAKSSESDEAVSTTDEDAPRKRPRVVRQAPIFERELDDDVLDAFSQLHVGDIFRRAAPTGDAARVQQLRSVAKALIESAPEINSIGGGRSVDWPDVLAIAENENWEEFESEEEDGGNNNNDESDDNGSNRNKSDDDGNGGEPEEGDDGGNWSDSV